MKETCPNVGCHAAGSNYWWPWINDLHQCHFGITTGSLRIAVLQLRAPSFKDSFDVLCCYLCRLYIKSCLFLQLSLRKNLSTWASHVCFCPLFPTLWSSSIVPAFFHFLMMLCTADFPIFNFFNNWAHTLALFTIKVYHRKRLFAKRWHFENNWFHQIAAQHFIQEL